MSTMGMVIYGVAALWAVQMLLSMMDQHRQQTLLRLKREEIARRAAENAAAEPSTTAVERPAPAPAGPRSVVAR